MDVKNKKVTVAGLGRTSLALVRLLLREGAMPYVTDASNIAALQPLKEELEELGVPYECGGHSARAFGGAALVIPSPGVPPAIEPIRRAVAAGARCISEMEFAYAYCRSKIIAVTGTNGKTTTTELIRSMLEACGRTVLLAGNNASPFSEAVMVDPAPEYIVLEVSSYQLELIETFHPWIGVLLNVSEDHLARHRTMELYAAAKAKLFAHQIPGEFAIVNADDPVCRRIAETLGPQVLRFSLSQQLDAGLWLDGDDIRNGGDAVAEARDTRLPGRHNLENALAALTAMSAGGFDWAAVLEGLRSFEGVEHRLERVASIDGVDYINDSKSTNLDSLKVALESFDAPVVLIAGGRGKGGDYAELRGTVAERVSTLITIGEDASRIEEAFAGAIPALRATGMDDAVAKAAEVAPEGGTVLLSPACASFDMYSDFEERGRDFKRAVNALRMAGNGAPQGMMA